MRAWVIYSLLRVGIFAAVFALLYWLLSPEFWWLSAICAALIALSISYIFLGGLRTRVAEDLAKRTKRSGRQKPADPDAAAEDRDDY